MTKALHTRGITAILAWLCCAAFASSLLGQPVDQRIPQPPQPLREFRGAWVATVHGVDWPYERGDSTSKQQAELVQIIEKAAALNLNTLIFQVRPAGDTIYKSDIEPWSPWMTGGMGKAPSPAWDPLEFFLKEAHARGIEVHAWFNPFRALSGRTFSGAGNHITVKNPEWCWRYGDNTWMDPGEPGVRAHSLRVILDVLNRYHVDGIHMDDYFYPYPIKSGDKTLEFPDDRTWNAYRTRGGKLTRSEWRRENVDVFVRDLYQAVKAAKPWVRVGISPFGVWRPNHPEGHAKGALDPYEALGADSRKWLQQGWCDYFSPQLYWPTEPANLSFPKLFDWWLMQNTARRHVWPGMASDRVLRDRQPHEILKQISYTRQRAPYMPPGHIHWNFTALKKNVGSLYDLCKTRAYEDMAIPPSAPWLGADRPPTPTLSMGDASAQWFLADDRLEAFVKWWVIQAYEGGKWKTVAIQPSDKKLFTPKKGQQILAVRGVGRTGISGDAATVMVGGKP